MLPNFMPMLANFVPMVPNFVPILLPNFVLMLPNFVPMLPNFVPILLPNFVLMLPNFVPMLPNFAGASFLRNGVFERRGPDVPHTSERSLRRKAREVLFGGDHARPAVPAQARWVDSTNRKSSSDRSRTVAHFCRNITGPAFWVRVSKKWPLQVQPLLTVPNERSVRLSCFLVVLDQRPFHCCFGPNTIPLFFGPKTIPLFFWTKDHSIVFLTKDHSIVVMDQRPFHCFLDQIPFHCFWTKDHSIVFDQRPFHCFLDQRPFRCCFGPKAIPFQSSPEQTSSRLRWSSVVWNGGGCKRRDSNFSLLGRNTSEFDVSWLGGAAAEASLPDALRKHTQKHNLIWKRSFSFSVSDHRCQRQQRAGGVSCE